MCSIMVFSASTCPCTRFSSDHPRVFDHALHQQPAEAAALERRAHDHGIFAALAVGIEMQAHHAEHLAVRFIDRDEGHRALVIEMREFGDALVREFADRGEEAQPRILGRDARGEIRIERGVFRAKDTHQHAPAVRQHGVMRQRVEVHAHGRYVVGGATNVNATSGSAASSPAACRVLPRRG